VLTPIVDADTLKGHRRANKHNHGDQAMFSKLASFIIALAVSMISVATTSIEPMTAERTDLLTLRVENATFATIRPDPIRLVIGTEMQAPMNAFASVESIIEGQVTPGIVYEVTVTDQSGDEPVRELIEVGMTREHEIQFVFFQMYELQETLRNEIDVNYFEMLAALRLLRERGYVQ